MSPTVQVLERVNRRAPFGLRLWDVASETFLAEELEVDLLVRTRPERRVRCPMNRSGIFYGIDVPGLRAFELSDPDDGLPPLHPFRVEVRDPAGSFLPIAFDVDLPSLGLITSLLPLTAPPQAFASEPGLGSPPAPVLVGVPMFSSPNRPAPEGLAVVRAQVLEIGTQRPAAWCLLTASIDGNARGIGLADGEGRIVVLFPYPDRPRPTLASPPPAVNDFRWSVELAAHYVPTPVAVPVPLVPDLAFIVAQLAAPPRTLFHSTGSPPQPLPALALEYRVPLTARTAFTPAGLSSFLFVSTA